MKGKWCGGWNRKSRFINNNNFLLSLSVGFLIYNKTDQIFVKEIGSPIKAHILIQI